MIGTNGLAVNIADNTPAYLVDESPSAESRYRARFYFDPNSILMNAGEGHNLFVVQQSPTSTVFWMQFLKFSSGYTIRFIVLDDNLGYRNLSYLALSDGPHRIEVDWQAGTGNGYLRVWLDGVFAGGITNLANASQVVERALLGPSAGIDTFTRGTYFLHEFESRRETEIGP
jgi:hypothetical protein